jgi:hypothetical protein
MFKIGELCEDSNRRIDKLFQGLIELDPSHHAIPTTVYRVAAPLVIVRALRQQLTTVDLRLDPVLRDQYLVARELLYALQNGRELSRCQPPVANYLAHLADRSSPMQHLTSRYMDGLLESLTRYSADGTIGLRSFFEFDQELRDQSTTTYALASPTLELFSRAHPEESPVLWRILMVHRLVQMTLLQLLEEDNFPASQDRKILVEPTREQYKGAYCEAFDAATAYLKDRDFFIRGIS